jgi:hypothetical protein
MSSCAKSTFFPEANKRADFTLVRSPPMATTVGGL